jgi:mRNA-degrading endonuclease RelE of RelBE toxin-antitoxin system
MTNFVFKSHPKFNKECKKLSRKCPSIKEDIDRLKKALEESLISNDSQVPTNNKNYVHVSRINSSLPVFKARRFRCRKINKGANSGFRLVFAYYRSLSLIYFIEFYYKQNKLDMDKKLATEACKNIHNQEDFIT